MWRDPIVEEIHAAREQIDRECGYDLKRIMDFLRRKEAEHPERIVRKGRLSRVKRTRARASLG